MEKTIRKEQVASLNRRSCRDHYLTLGQILEEAFGSMSLQNTGISGCCTSTVICGSKSTQSFPIQASAKQGCILFLLILDWIMTNAGKRQGDIRWTLSYLISDLVCLSVHRHTDVRVMAVDMAQLLFLNLKSER